MLNTVNVASGKDQLLWLFFKPSGKTSNLFEVGKETLEQLLNHEVPFLLRCLF